MSHRSRWWAVLVGVAVVAAAEWLREPALPWVGGLVAAAALAPLALRPLRRAGPAALLLVLAALATAAALAQRELDAIEHDWAAGRERRVTAASGRLAGELHRALERTERLAALAASLGGLGREEAFARLADALPGDGPETAVTILERTGAPWSWAGRHRVRPRAEGDSLAARITGYYVVLESRRHSTAGRVAVASVLVWAHPVVPDRGRSLAEIFRARTEVGLRVFHPDSAPDRPDVFDYQEPTTAGPRLLFSVQPVPPEQGAARELAFARGGSAVAWILLLLVILALTQAAGPLDRYALLVLFLYAAARSPLGTALQLESLFSPATFYRGVLGPLSGSAGVLALTGALATIAGVSLWRLRLPRTGASVLAGGALLFTAPYLVRDIGRGITPPAEGVPTGLWLLWETGLVLTVSAVIVLAAAFFHGREPAPDRAWPTWAGVGIALTAAVLGIFLWSPRGGWPNWYTFLWTPALVLVSLPARRGRAIAGIALVAGSAAALVTWGAVLEGRLDVARRDLAHLGDEPDPLAVALLERLGDQLGRERPPATPTELYALWRASDLSTEDYPSRLALWAPDGELRFELPLDSLDLPTPLLSALVQNLDTTSARSVMPVLRVPGVHHVLLMRLAPDAVLTAAVGPRTALIVPDRLSRLLDPSRGREALYGISLSPPAAEPPPAAPVSRWNREGWSVRSEQQLALPGGVRHVHATIDLRGPAPVLVRGALVVLLDVAILAALWVLAEALAGQRARGLRWRRAVRSFQARLAVALGVFFVIPAAGFAGWSFTRLDDEARRGRDLLTTQTLRGAVPAAGALLQAPAARVDEGLVDLSRRIDADLALYSGGVLSGSSDPILEDLGLFEPLLDPRAFRTLALGDELETAREGPGGNSALRAGYRVVQPGPPGGVGVLATLQPADGATLAEEQLDLAYVLLLATLIGVAAALAGAQVAARALSRPVADLRRSALELGRGNLESAPTQEPPVEFEPVFAAFRKMASDIRASQAALEEARRRTASVLATVATGVVALDREGRVLIANRRASEILGVALPEGQPLSDLLDEDWAGMKEAVRRYRETPASEDAASELDVRGRRLRLQFAALGAGLGGIVLALDDLTGVTQAERVLAWGEMARQVAHEIKNPLTPIRLGMQHLRRAYRDRKAGFDQVLEETSERILSEIDRLDTIARAFSRFAAPAAEEVPLDCVDLVGTAQEVVDLYRLGADGAELRLVAPSPVEGLARKDEVKEVLVNLVENARNAGATLVTLTVTPGRLLVEDNGRGIPPEQLPRIFEPRFSTTTSGSGLGLAIVRRLVESWAGRIGVESEVGRGTRVTIEVRPPGSGAA